MAQHILPMRVGIRTPARRPRQLPHL